MSTAVAYGVRLKVSTYGSIRTSVHIRLHFRDGSFWVMGCTSALGEQDAGSLYPTTMESTDGNQILITYQTGVGGSTSNTSARITQINDSRGTTYGFSYVFTYTYTGSRRLTTCPGLRTPSERQKYTISR